MHRLLDVLASGVHDAKNQLFFAESLIAAAEAEHGLDLGEARYAIEAAAGRLSRTLATYKLLRKGATLAITPAVVADLVDEIVLAQRKHLEKAGIALSADCRVLDEWAFDRELVTDILSNAVQNAARHAKSRIALTAMIDDGMLLLRVEDDGEGFANPDASPEDIGGTGLYVAERLARMHERHGRHGSLRLSNGGQFGGAVFELRLP